MKLILVLILVFIELVSCLAERNKYFDRVSSRNRIQAVPGRACVRWRSVLGPFGSFWVF